MVNVIVVESHDRASVRRMILERNLFFAMIVENKQGGSSFVRIADTNRLLFGLVIAAIRLLSVRRIITH